MFEGDEETGLDDPVTGSVVSFVGHTAIPCVCEAPPSSAPLFSNGGSKVVAEGITWQSLYLILLGRHLVLAEPERRYVIYSYGFLFTVYAPTNLLWN